MAATFMSQNPSLPRFVCGIAKVGCIALKIKKTGHKEVATVNPSIILESLWD